MNWFVLTPAIRYNGMQYVANEPKGAPQMAPERIITDKTDENLKPYQPFGIPMMWFLFGLTGLSLLVTAIYKYCW